MKSVLYVAAAIMIGTSIYGFVDYSKTRRHSEFKTMYNENETANQSIAVEKTQPDVVVPLAIREKSGVKEEEPVKNETKPGLAKASTKQEKKIRKKRSVNYKSFSRAPLGVEPIVFPELKEVKLEEQ